MSIKNLLIFLSISFSSSFVFSEPSNLIHNSSFELGMAGFEMNSLIFPDKEMSLKYVTSKIDKTTKVHGNVSLKISNPKSNFFRFMSDNIKLVIGQEYYISIWMKSNIEKYPIRFVVESVAKGSKWDSNIRIYYISKEWKRYGYHFKVPKNGIHTDYVIRIESEPIAKRISLKNARISGSLWLDALQLNKGKEREYQPLSNIESSITLNKSFPLYDPSEDITGQIHIIQYSGEPTENSFSYDIIDDYFTKNIISKIEKFKIMSNQIVNLEFKIKDIPRGGYVIKGRIIKPEKDSSYASTAYFAVSESGITNKPLASNKFSLGINMSPYASGYWGLPSSSPVLVKKDGFSDFFKYYASQGVRWFRDWGGRPAFTWIDIEPESSKFNWQSSDYFVESAAKYNIRVIPVLGGSSFEDDKVRGWSFKKLPDWVIKRAKILPAPDVRKALKGYKLILPNLEDWKNYIKAIVKHYKGEISHYEVMNEPNLYMQAKDYVKYLKVAYETAKKVDPDCHIIAFCATGDLGGQLVSFMEECFKLGGLKYADIISFHPYNARLTGTPKSAQSMISILQEKKAKYGGEGKPLWNTELYYMNTEVKSGFDASIIKGNEIARRYFIDLGEGLQQSMPLQHLFNSKNTVFRNRHSGVHTSLIPSFRYVIYTQLARLFEGAKPITRIQLPNRDVCYVVEKNDKLIAIIWNYDKTKFDFMDLYLQTAEVSILNMFGNKIKLVGTNKISLKLTNDPYYIFWDSKDKTKFINALKNADIRGEKSILLTGIKINKQALVFNLENTTNKAINGFIKINSHPAWLKPSSVSRTYGPVLPHKSYKGKIPIELKKGMSEKGKVIFLISTPNEVLEFKMNVLKPLFYNCNKLSVSPTIDGKIESKEWSKTSSIDLNKLKNVKIGNVNKWSGPNDCSAIVHTGYDSKYIYFAISVKDDLKGMREKGMPWTGDAVELFLDISKNMGKFYTANTYQIFFAPESGVNIPAMSKNFNFKKGIWKSSRGNSNYEIEIAIPFSELGLKASNIAGKSIDFDIAIDDADKGKRENQMIWCGDGKNYKNRSKFGRLIFEK